MSPFCHFKAWELTSESGLINMVPAKAREPQHKAIQHSNALSLGSHFNHSLFCATVPARCKLCWAVINPCQVREDVKKLRRNEMKADILVSTAPPMQSAFSTRPRAILFSIHKINLGPPRSWSPPTVLLCS